MTTPALAPKTRQRRQPPDPMAKMVKQFDAQTKLLNATVKDLKSTKLRLRKLDKQNKYLQDRVSATERNIGNVSGSIGRLETSVNRLMGIFKR